MPGGATAPSPNFAWPPRVPPKIFRVTSCHWSRSLSESPTQTIDSSPCCKTGPSSGPPNENVWLRPCSNVVAQTDLAFVSNRRMTRSCRYGKRAFFSVTVTDCRVLSQYHSFVITLDGAGATRPALDKGDVLMQLCS